MSGTSGTDVSINPVLGTGYDPGGPGGLPEPTRAGVAVIPSSLGGCAM